MAPWVPLHPSNVRRHHVPPAPAEEALTPALGHFVLASANMVTRAPTDALHASVMTHVKASLVQMEKSVSGFGMPTVLASCALDILFVSTYELITSLICTRVRGLF